MEQFLDGPEVDVDVIWMQFMFPQVLGGVLVILLGIGGFP